MRCRRGWCEIGVGRRIRIGIRIRRGIGADAAQAGVDVALVSRSQAKLKPVAEAAIQAGVQAQAYAIDLADVEQVREQISAIAQDGPIDVLINNAGMGYTTELIDTPLTDWQTVINLNLTSVFQCIQAVLPSMRTRQRGTIVNVVSIAGRQAFAGCHEQPQ